MRLIPESSPPARFAQVVREHPLVTFLLILYSVSWVLFLRAVPGAAEGMA